MAFVYEVYLFHTMIVVCYTFFSLRGMSFISSSVKAAVSEKADALVFVQGKDNLAVAPGLEGILSGITRTDVPVIVYLAVDGKDLFTVGRVQGLSARLGIDDGKTLVRKDC